MAQDWKSTDLEAGLERAEAGQEQTTLGTSPSSRGWKTGLALLAIGLCAAGAIFFFFHDQMQTKQKRDITDGSEDLTTALKQISTRHSGKHQLAIHLEGEFNKDFSNKTVQWSSGIDQAFEMGLKLRDNKIIIPKSGLYFVYSQVSYRVNCQVQSNDDDQELLGEPVDLYHSVFRNSQTVSAVRPLMKARRSSCERVESDMDTGNRWFGAINLGAIFKLEEDDELHTVTEPLSSVEGESGKTFFGVFAL